MINIRKSNDRGHANHGWLEAYHTFSFADYFDPRFVAFQGLRVINEDRVQPGEGFGKHGHKNMEIVTYVLEGELEHKDSMGTGSVLRYGDVQRMSAGRGVLHSEFNASKEKLLHLLQIWILPTNDGGSPGYEEKHFGDADKKNQLRLIVSPDGRDGSLQIHTDAAIYASVLEGGKSVAHPLARGRHSWVQLTRGSIEINGETLDAGDGAAISGETALELKAKKTAEFLLFDLAQMELKA